jgi:hypothetical protein
MPKSKREPVPDASDLPPVVRDALSLPTPPAAPEPAPPPQQLPASVTIEVPLGQLDQGYLSRHVEARLTTTMQCESLRRLTNGLRQAGERLDDGKPVASYADAMRWLLEQLVQGA